MTEFCRAQSKRVNERIVDVDAVCRNDTCVSVYNFSLTHIRYSGNRVAIMGAGGIGFDVATFLAHRRSKVEPETIEHFNRKVRCATLCFIVCVYTSACVVCDRQSQRY